MKTIEKLIDNFNASWTTGDYVTFEKCLHDDVIFMSPDFKQSIIGKKACTESIQQYNKIAETKHFEVTNSQIFQWGSTANVIMDYYIEYRLNDTDHKENGKESWTIKLDSLQWKVLWRALLENNKIT